MVFSPPQTLNKSILRRLFRAKANKFSSGPDLLIHGGRVMDVIKGRVIEADIAIKHGMITGVYPGGYSIHNMPPAREIDATGLTIAPGFINGHLHIESSLITPQEYSRMVTPRGTTTIVCDPHEMANVIGVKAFDFFLDSAQESILDIYVGLSSCVPATPLGTSGADIRAADLKAYMGRNGVIGLAEMMNIGGMMADDPVVVDKLELFGARYIGGHMPGITDQGMLQKFRGFGICDDHECTSADEAEIKLREGFNIMIREGTAAKNLSDLMPIINDCNKGHLLFCTDDRHPDEVMDEGEMDHIIRKAIAAYDPALNGVDRDAHIMRVYQMATYWAAENFKLQNCGAIEKNRRADLVFLQGDIAECNVQTVFKDGMEVNTSLLDQQVQVNPRNYGAYDSVHFKGRGAITPGVFDTSADIDTQGNTVEKPVIGIIPGQIITTSEKAHLPLDHCRRVLADTAQDIAHMAVIERHGKNGNIQNAFVKGLGLKDGAIASTVAHDDHNLVVAGTDRCQMALAANVLKNRGGGFVLVRGGSVIAQQPLPVAGLMSDQSWEDVADRQRAFLKAVRGSDISLKDPTMTLAFLTLAVIPRLKLSDKVGLTIFDPADGEPVPRALG